jgi:basic amino acid/polyamine antiporter, APA family
MTTPADGSKPRVLGAFAVGSVAIGAMMGVGIFFTPAKVAARAGDFGTAVAIWIFGGAAALLGALTFAEIGARIPEAGGQFRALREVFGRRVGFAYATAVGLGESCAAVAILALVCVRYVGVATDVEFSDSAASAFACGGVLLAFAFSASGVRSGASALIVNVALKPAIALTIAVLAATTAGAPTSPTTDAAAAATASSPPHGAGSVFAAFLPALFAYGGWQQTLWIGGAVRDPARNLPRGVVGGTLVVVAAYLALNLSYFSLLGFERAAESSAIAADAAAVDFPYAGRAIAAAVAWSAFGCMQAILFTGPFQAAAAAEVGAFPRFFAARAKNGAPRAAAVLFAATSAAFVLLAGIEGLDVLLDAVVCVDWLFFALTGCALFLLRRRFGPPKGFRVPGYPVVPAVFVLVATLAAIGPFFDAKARVGGFIAVGSAAALWLLGGGGGDSARAKARRDSTDDRA